MRGAFGTRLAVLALASATVACAAPPIHESEPDALRREIARDVPGLSGEQVVIPHALSRETLQRLQQRIPQLDPDQDDARALLSLLFDEDQLGLAYEWSATRDAETTIAEGAGNCLSLSAVVVAVARAHRGAARYIEIKGPPERRVEGDLLIWSSHVAVLLPSHEGMLIIDFLGAERAGPLEFRILSDRSLVAHYYLDRGYERIHRAHAAGAPADWESARRDFDIARRVDPELGDAWNNLGVALARLGRFAEAESAYHEAKRTPQRGYVDSATTKNLAVLERRRSQAGVGLVPLE